MTPEDLEVLKRKIKASGNHYDTLGITRTAQPGEISKAFKHLALKFHPDKNNHADAEEVFKKVNLAWECLRDSSTKIAYDYSLRTTSYSRVAPRKPAQPAYQSPYAPYRPAPYQYRPQPQPPPPPPPRPAPDVFVQGGIRYSLPPQIRCPSCQKNFAPFMFYMSCPLCNTHLFAGVKAANQTAPVSAAQRAAEEAFSKREADRVQREQKERDANKANAPNGFGASSSAPPPPQQPQSSSAHPSSTPDFGNMSVKDLKKYLDDHQVDYKDCVEKADLLRRAIETYAKTPASAAASAGPSQAGAAGPSAAAPHPPGPAPQPAAASTSAPKATPSTGRASSKPAKKRTARRDDDEEEVVFTGKKAAARAGKMADEDMEGIDTSNIINERRTRSRRNVPQPKSYQVDSSSSSEASDVDVNESEDDAEETPRPKPKRKQAAPRQRATAKPSAADADKENTERTKDEAHAKVKDEPSSVPHTQASETAVKKEPESARAARPHPKPAAEKRSAPTPAGDSKKKAKTGDSDDDSSVCITGETRAKGSVKQKASAQAAGPAKKQKTGSGEDVESDAESVSAGGNAADSFPARRRKAAEGTGNGKTGSKRAASSKAGSSVKRARKSDSDEGAVASESEAESLEEDEYIVEKVLDRKREATGFKYLVKWENFPDTSNSWEPARNICDTPAFKEFMAKLTQDPLSKTPIGRKRGAVKEESSPQESPIFDFSSGFPKRRAAVQAAEQMRKSATTSATRIIDDSDTEESSKKRRRPKAKVIIVDSSDSEQ